MATPEQNQHSIAGTDQPEARTTGNGRRAYVRYPVVLDATMVVGQERNIPCAMRDYCMGGMLLHFKQQSDNGQPISVAVRDIVTIRCIVPDPQGNRLLDFPARVVRSIQGGVGIAFINPDMVSLQVMQQFALQHSLDANNPHADKISEIKRARDNTGSLGRRYNDIITGCARIIQETLDTLLEQIGAKLANHLLDLSREENNSERQSDFFTASETISSSNAQFLHTIRSTFQQRLEERTTNIIDPNQTKKEQSGELSLEDMTLVGDEDLDAWLAVSELTNKVEERNKESLSNLEQRLSVMFGVQISHVNNPFAPDIFAESFQAGLVQYKFKESVNVACYAFLKEIFIPTLSSLYEKLNGILIEYGILPKLKYSPLVSSTSSNKMDDVSDQSQVAGSPSPDQSFTDESVPYSGDDITNQTQASDLQPSGQADTSNDSTRDRAAHTQDPPHDLYQLVQDLRDLRRQFTPSRTYAPGDLPQDFVTRDTQQYGPQSPTTFYSTSELIEAVADLQARIQPVNGEETQIVPIKSRLLAALGERNSNTDAKGINVRDSNVVEVAGDFLSALQSDPLVAGSVKPWLKQLELPVLKLALKDPTLFFDQSHVARQVVNSIAQLEFYQQGGANSRDNSISGAIENLLDKIALERSDGVEIFSEIQAKLNKLIKIQNMAYEDNIKDVVQACKDNLPIPEVYEFESIAGEDVSESEIRKWTMFARRLHEGDDVMYSSLDSKPQRLRVAWVDEKKTLYVFVNLRGIKEKVLNVSDVARMIRLGIMEPQGNAADPAMDRAQYSIMQNLYKQVVYESTHDSLTGLINRREFTRRLEDAVMDAKRYDKRHTLMIIDIDQFSAINGDCGYGGGDKLLQDVMGIIESDLDGRGVVSRVGADEFAVLINEVSFDDALAIAEQKIEDVANYKLDWDGGEYSVTLSVGIVPISARSGSIDELMQAAEVSCKTAKDAGGNRLQVFHAGYSRVRHQAEVKKWAANVDKMLEDDVLEIRCQRIEPIDCNSSLRPHFEILLGVKDEQGNIGSPLELIKGAELSHKMSTIDRYVITKTLKWMNDNAGIIEKIAGFNINLSGESLNEDGFIDYILDRLQDVRVPYDKICFEVTETVGITNLSDAGLGIERIKDTGCRFALDDFGSGMSSYGYLKNLPVDLVKIDGTFVKELVANSSDYAVIKSITEIAHFMNKKVVAEYVETSDTMELLRDIGVDYAQGYIIDKPGSLDRLVNMQFSEAV